MFGLFPTHGSSPLSGHPLLRLTVGFERKDLAYRNNLLFKHIGTGVGLCLLQKVIKDDMRLSLFVKSFRTLLYFWDHLGRSRILNEP